jgi:zinc transport system substrate-binding protein
MSSITHCAAAALLLVAAAACGGTSPQTESPAAASTSAALDATRLTVYTVNYPLAYFAQRIAGEHAEVVFPPSLAQGDPAYAQPDAETIAAFQGADLILRNGAGYAGWAELVTLPESKVVDTSTAFTDRLITVAGAMTHSHGPEGEHSHDETAFTTWLDLELAIEQASAIATALSAARPEAAAAFDANLAALRADLQELDESLAAAGARLGGTPLLASHPVYQYFARRYGLELESVHFEPDAVPDEEAWRELETLLSEHAATTMIWEAQPIPEIVDRLALMGIDVLVFAPCATPPAAEEDFLSVMRGNAQRFARLAAAGAR